MEDFVLTQCNAAGKTETCAVAEESDECTGFQQLEVPIHTPRHRWKCYRLVVHPDAFHSSVGFALAPLAICRMHLYCNTLSVFTNLVICHGVKERMRVNVLLCLDNSLHFVVPVLHCFNLSTR